MMFRRLVSVCLLLVCPAIAQSQPADRADGWVVLSVGDYHALRSSAFPSERPPEPLPLDAAIARIEYELTVADARAAGSAVVTIDVLKDGWVYVPLPKGLFIREARLGTTPLPIVHTQAATQVLLARKGRAVVSLDLVVPITARAGVEQAVLPAAAAGLVKATLDIPRGDVDVRVAGGVIVERPATRDVSRIVAHGTAGQPLSFTWERRRDTDRAALPPVVRSGLQHVVSLGEEVGHVTALVTATIVRGRTDTLSVAVPFGLTITQVQGADVADWELQSSVLAISLLQAIERETNVLVTAEFRPPASGSVSVPLLRLSGAERETGMVAVEIVGAGEIVAHTARGLDPADPADLQGLTATGPSPAIVAFRYRPQAPSRDRALDLRVDRFTPHDVLLALVEEARYRVLLAEDGSTLVEASLAVRNNQRSFLGLTLPPGSTLWSATVDGRPVRAGRGAGDLLLLPLQKRGAGERAPDLAIRVLYLDKSVSWMAEGERRLILPALDVPVQRTGLQLHHSPRFRLGVAPGPFHVQPFAPPRSPTLASLDRVITSAAPAKAATPPDGGSASGLRIDAPRLTNEAQQRDERTAAGEVRTLIDHYQRSTYAVRATGVPPVPMTFPDRGPRLYLATELTPEGVAPEATLVFKRMVK
jgi:hypothetical protein